MLAKIKVGNPELTQDIDGNYKIAFPVNPISKYATRQLVKNFRQNNKLLELKLDYFTKHRSLDQNALLWALLGEYAQFLNGGRKAEITEEDLYYKLLEKHGVAIFLRVREDAFETLKQVYKKVQVIDRNVIKGIACVTCKCWIGSSNYDTKQMTDLIDGLLDEMEQAGVRTETVHQLEEEYRNSKR